MSCGKNAEKYDPMTRTWIQLYVEDYPSQFQGGKLVEGPNQTFYSFKGLSYPDPPGMDGDFEFDYNLNITRK